MAFEGDGFMVFKSDGFMASLPKYIRKLGDIYHVAFGVFPPPSPHPSVYCTESEASGIGGEGGGGGHVHQL